MTTKHGMNGGSALQGKVETLTPEKTATMKHVHVLIGFQTLPKLVKYRLLFRVFLLLLIFLIFLRTCSGQYRKISSRCNGHILGKT